jgi:hypothetical protein
MTPAHRLRAETLAAYNAAKDALAAEITEATEAIRAKHQPQINTLYKAFTDAHEALLREQSDTATHPWAGKKVWASKYRRGESVGNIYGTVEVRRIGTVIPKGLKYDIPLVGTAFVRLHKADGKPGLALDRLTDRWRLCDVG